VHLINVLVKFSLVDHSNHVAFPSPSHAWWLWDPRALTRTLHWSARVSGRLPTPDPGLARLCLEAEEESGAEKDSSDHTDSGSTDQGYVPMRRAGRE